MKVLAEFAGCFFFTALSDVFVYIFLFTSLEKVRCEVFFFFFFNLFDIFI